MAVSKAKAVPASPRQTLSPFERILSMQSQPSRQRPAHPLEETLVEALSRLAEAQWEFSRQLALPEARAFPASAAYLGSAPPRALIRRWLQDPVEGPERIEALISDLVGHQRALTAALEPSLLGAAHRRLEAGEAGEAPLWARVVRALLPRRWQEKADRDPELRPLYLLAPAFVVAYAQARGR